MSLSMTADNRESVLSLILGGQLTRVDTIPFKEWAVGQIDEHGAGRVEVDCSDLTYLDSAGLGSLIFLRKVVGERGGAMVLTRVGGWLRKFLQVTGLEQALTVPNPVAEKQG
ncbi:MAG: STAS domain-containing protein [Planctomycetota bacterium]